MKIVFSAWSGEGETGYDIWKGGVRGIVEEEAEGETVVT